MRTKRGLCCPKLVDVCLDQRVIFKKRRIIAGERKVVCRKRPKLSPGTAGQCDLFEAFPDDLVVSILCKLCSTARCPSDFVNVLMTYVFYLYLFVSSDRLLEKFHFTLAGIEFFSNVAIYD